MVLRTRRKTMNAFQANDYFYKLVDTLEENEWAQFVGEEESVVFESYLEEELQF